MAEEGKIKRFKRVSADNEIEREIVTAAITSTEFLRKIRGKVRKDHFVIEYSWQVIKWVQEYFDRFEEAPGREITAIYKDHSKKIKNEALKKIIQKFLEGISSDYEGAAAVNVGYLFDRTLQYLRQRDLCNLTEKMTTALDRGDVNAASEEYVKFQTVHAETTRHFNPFDLDYIKEVFWEDYEGKKGLVLPGALGEMVGPIERQWLLSIIAPEKRGKTNILDELTMQSVFAGFRTLHVSLEMPEKDKRRRFWRRITGRAEEEGWVIVPVLDCKKNQDNSCRLSERACRRGLLNKFGEKPEFELGKKYTTCTSCLDAGNLKEYDADFWYDKIWVEEIDQTALMRKAEAVRQMYGDRLRVKCWPAYEANVQDIKSYLDEIKASEGFIPDVILIDYPDILKPEAGSRDDRASIDRTWKACKNLSQVRNCIVIVVEQSTRDTYNRDIDSLADTTEDKRKNAHIDIKMAMNLLSKEEEAQVMRFCIIAHRHKYFHTDNEVIVLQQLSIGQPLLDSAWYRKKKRKTEDEKKPENRRRPKDERGHKKGD